MILSGVMIAGALLWVVREPILFAVGDFLVIQNTLEPADVIHVIAGPDDRTDYAIQLYRQGYGKQILFTGGWCKGHGYYHGAHGVERAAAQGVLSQNILVDESPVTGTYGEAVVLKGVIARSPRPVQSVIVVSDPYHMRRSRWTYRTVLGSSIDVQMAPVPFDVTHYERRWWTDDESKRYIKEEYLKLAYYYARYRLTSGWLRQWLASLDDE